MTRTDTISSMLTTTTTATTTTTTMIAASCSSNTLSSSATAASSAITTTTTATTDDEVDNWVDIEDDIDGDKQQQKEDSDDDDDVFTKQFLQRGEWLRQLRELERQDGELRAKANEGHQKAVHQHQTTDNENDHGRVQQPLQNDDTNHQSSDNTLRYNSEFLALGPSKQIYDDYKHVNFKFIELDDLPELSFLMGQSSTLTIEQDRTLGKGGFVWDAGFILAQTLIRRHQCTTNTRCSKSSDSAATTSTTTVNTSNSSSLNNTKRPFLELPDPFQSPTTTSTNYSSSSSLSMVELGSGTGICGLMIAAALSSETHVNPSVTQGPSPSFESCSNQVRINDDGDDATIPTTTTTMNDHFHHGNDNGNTSDKIDIVVDNNKNNNGVSIHLTDLPNLQDLLHRNIGQYYSSDRHSNDSGEVTVTNGILEWGRRTSTSSTTTTTASTTTTYDIILGGDVVAGIYDSTALVESIVDMSHISTRIYLALRERLTGCIELFIDKLYDHFDTIDWYQPNSSNYSPNVFILYVTNKR